MRRRRLRRRRRIARVLVPRVLAVAVVLGCRAEQPRAPSGGLPVAAPPPRLPAQFDIGRTATAADIAPIDIDVNPAGDGLPPGEGTYTDGAAIYAHTCAPCHGAHGEGNGPNPRLIGADPQQGFPFGRDYTIPKTIGNYWPYATTLYDYVHRAMPLTAPGSLTPHETYALVAYLLAENQVVPRSAIMDARTLPRVVMPARSHFVPDDRTGGQPFR